jgi:hypothetical protein
MRVVVADFKGLKELQNALKRAGDEGPQLLGQALYEEAQVAFSESQILTPIRTGALRGSGTVHTPEKQYNRVSVAITYGGPAAPYALWVHEIGRYKHYPPTRSKFLQIPVEQRKEFLTQKLATRINHMMRKNLR